jgi:hypothetical protein
MSSAKNIIIAIILICWPVLSVAGIIYSIKDLGTVRPAAINNLGQIAGYSSSGHVAFLDNGNITLLNNLGYGKLKLNNNGQVMNTAGDVGYSYVWKDGVYKDIPAEIHGINDNGELVGAISGKYGNNGAHIVKAILYRNDQIVDLGLYPSTNYSWAEDINNSSEIIGSYFYWKDGELTYDIFQTSMDINNNGFALLIDSSNSYLWNRGVAVDLGRFRGVSINDRNQVVGTGENSDTNIAVLWNDGELYNLNELIDPSSKWFLYDAVSINDNGQIVGTGVNAQGKSAGFLLTPVQGSVPEPRSDILTLLGLLIIAISQAKKESEKYIG